jgi:hypothetical protein
MLSKDETRRLLATSFEPHGEGFVYYKHRWSSGLPVTAAEREEYLSNWSFFSSQRTLLNRIGGREPVAPPRDGKAVWPMVDALPGRLPWILAGTALLSAGSALRTDEPWVRLEGSAVAVILAACSLALVIRRLYKHGDAGHAS